MAVNLKPRPLGVFGGGLGGCWGYLATSEPIRDHAQKSVMVWFRPPHLNHPSEPVPPYLPATFRLFLSWVGTDAFGSIWEQMRVTSLGRSVFSPVFPDHTCCSVHRPLRLPVCTPNKALEPTPAYFPKTPAPKPTRAPTPASPFHLRLSSPAF